MKKVPIGMLYKSSNLHGVVVILHGAGIACEHKPCVVFIKNPRYKCGIQSSTCAGLYADVVYFSIKGSSILLMLSAGMYVMPSLEKTVWYHSDLHVRNDMVGKEWFVVGVYSIKKHMVFSSSIRITTIHWAAGNLS